MYTRIFVNTKRKIALYVFCQNILFIICLTGMSRHIWICVSLILLEVFLCTVSSPTGKKTKITGDKIHTMNSKSKIFKENNSMLHQPESTRSHHVTFILRRKRDLTVHCNSQQCVDEIIALLHSRDPNAHVLLGGRWG